MGTEGAVVELRVRVTGNPRPDVYWRKGPVRDIDTSKGRFRIKDDGSLQVSWGMCTNGLTHGAGAAQSAQK